jgi:hypothetical protein
MITLCIIEDRPQSAVSSAISPQTPTDRPPRIRAKSLFAFSTEVEKHFVAVHVVDFQCKQTVA